MTGSSGTEATSFPLPATSFQPGADPIGSVEPPGRTACVGPPRSGESAVHEADRARIRDPAQEGNHTQVHWSIPTSETGSAESPDRCPARFLPRYSRESKWPPDA